MGHARKGISVEIYREVFNVSRFQGLPIHLNYKGQVQD